MRAVPSRQDLQLAGEVMMGNDYERDNSGTLFKNSYKDPKKLADAKKPDYTGDALINGQQMRLSAWVKDGAKGKFMSLAFSPKDGGGQQQANNNRPAQSAPPPEDEVPF
jgi:hypothetical protein